MLQMLRRAMLLVTLPLVPNLGQPVSRHPSLDPDHAPLPCPPINPCATRSSQACAAAA